MNYLISKFCLSLAIVVLLVGLNSCGHEQQLVSISIQPQTEIFGASNIPVSAAQAQPCSFEPLATTYTRLFPRTSRTRLCGIRIHQQMVTVDAATGLTTVTGQACGDTLISAT